MLIFNYLHLILISLNLFDFINNYIHIMRKFKTNLYIKTVNKYTSTDYYI